MPLELWRQGAVPKVHYIIRGVRAAAHRAPRQARNPDKINTYLYNITHNTTYPYRPYPCTHILLIIYIIRIDNTIYDAQFTAVYVYRCTILLCRTLQRIYYMFVSVCVYAHWERVGVSWNRNRIINIIISWSPPLPPYRYGKCVFYQHPILCSIWTAFGQTRFVPKPPPVIRTIRRRFRKGLLCIILYTYNNNTPRT